MATIRIILGIICLAFFGSNFQLNSNFLGIPSKIQTQFTHHKLSDFPNNEEEKTRRKIVETANSQLGIREATEKNDGKQVEAYLHYTGNKKGDPWCASFVSWVFGQAGLSAPKTAWSPNMFPKTRSTLQPQPGDVLGIYSQPLKRIAHCGIVTGHQENWVLSTEGNTNRSGTREGDGVYTKRRHRLTIAKFANWLN